jgi:hypothetical protein
MAQGDLTAALKSYKADVAIRERLAASDAGNAQWQRDLIISYNKIADCAPSERRAYLSRALDIAKSLDASGRLAPADKWMPDDLARLITELPAAELVQHLIPRACCAEKPIHRTAAEKRI